MTRLAYRLNGLLIFVNMSLRFLMVVFLLQIAFLKTNAIAGWTKPEIFLFYGVFLLVDSIFDTFFAASLQKIPNLIEDGDLDFVLTKPANSLFIISFKEFYLLNFLNIIFSAIVISYAIKNLNIILLPINIILFAILIILGAIVYYSIYLILATISFHTIHTPFTELLESISGIMRFPLNIFGDKIKFIFTFILPLIFVVTVPAEAFMGLLSNLTILAPLMTALVFLVALKFWNFSLKRYSSASS